MVLSLSVAGCVDSEDEEAEPGIGSDGEWGPLAVRQDDSTDIDRALGGRGTLRIDSDCVRLETEDRGEIVLIWRSGDVEWAAAAQSVSVRSPTGQLELVDGDRILVSGNDSDIAKVTWLAEPAATCAGPVFNVHQVTLLDE
jgi:hypothetical protein